MTLTATLALAASAWGILGAAGPLLMIRSMRRSGTAQGVSVSYLALSASGYAVWLLYGIATHSVPLIL